MYKAECNHGTVPAEKLIELLRTAASAEDDIWITGNSDYPCLALLVNNNDTVLHYFGDERDTGSISVGDSSRYGQTVTFGDIELDGQYAVSRETAAECAKLFIQNGSRPRNIQWAEL